MQVHDALMPLAHVVGVRTRLIAGGLSYTKQISGLERGVELVIATPGRLADLVERGACDLREVEFAVLDEADHMAEMGFLPAITELLDMIPVGGQRLLFSATLDKGIDGVVERYLIDPVTHATEAAQASRHDDGPPRPARRAQPQGRRHRRDRRPRGPHDRLRAHQARRRPGRRAAAAARVSRRPRCTAAWPRARATPSSTRSRRARCPSSSPPTSRPAASTSTTSASCSRSTRPQDHKDYLHRAGRTARAGGREPLSRLPFRTSGGRSSGSPLRPGSTSSLPPRGRATRPSSGRPVRAVLRARRSRTRTSAGSPPCRASAAAGRARSGGPRREGGPVVRVARVRDRGRPASYRGWPGPLRRQARSRASRRSGGPVRGGGKRFDSKPTRSR